MNSKVNVLWHCRWGYGNLVGDAWDEIIVSFSGNHKVIKRTDYMKTIFLSKEDFGREVDVLYPIYKELLINKGDKRDLHDYKLIDFEMWDKYTDNKMNNAHFLLPTDDNKKTNRCIILLSRSIVKIKDKHFLRLIGLDVKSGLLVKIVDTNGMKYNLHTDDNEWRNLDILSEISADFIKINTKYENTLRVVSMFKIVERQVKWVNICNVRMNPVKDFKEIDLFMSQELCNHKNYCLVNLTGTQIHSYQGSGGEKYQIKVNRLFADIVTKNIQVEKYVNQYFRGIALLELSKINGNSIIKVIELYGRFLNQNEFILIKDKKKKEGKEIIELAYKSMEALENIENSILDEERQDMNLSEECIEWDEEDNEYYIQQQKEMLGEIDGYYEDYLYETLEEYSTDYPELELE